MELDNVTLSRLLTSMTLVFHIIFATIGVGIPLMIAIAEGLGILKKDPHYSLMARRWARGYTITVAVGVVTGTCIGLQLSLLWPSFMRIAGQAISFPLFMETFAFFFEAIFLGIYLYTWDRFKKPIYHWLIILPVILGSTLSAFFITTVNAFMNTPQGFTLKNGAIKTVDPIAAMFNPAAPSKTLHVIVTAYVASALILTSIAAIQILRGMNTEYTRKGLRLAATLGLIFAVLTGITGDVSAKFLAKYQPEKLAAIEWHFETQRGADFVLFGTLDDQTHEVKYEIRIPKLLSFLSFSDFNAPVIGLNEFPKDETPPLYIHYLFDIKMTFVGLIISMTFIFVVFSIKKKNWMHNKWLLRGLAMTGPLAMINIELGWMIAEVGRQPWILRGYMKVSEGATTAKGLGGMFWLFFVLYVFLGVFCTIVIRKMFIHNPPEDELQYRLKK
ncbi:cytochrome ubiquinol oxidase subunit I [Bacillus sp. AFS017336]|uniref:cytochrome ubiquinol oxidase subunit I n=1 Tax=Bacillus sp. AFS017336 TaxID=2033489 RepID=UPI000BF085C7|nr:cytochrome ubiquinol oxidase subunit I [Bacillus sp. AFS017336]PEL13617.1 cytochrome ubiquinol oxidase subunit I [Bacillus sp. AFS017336]